MAENNPTVPADVVARVEGAELETLIRKVQGGATLTPQERKTFTILSEKYGPKGAGQPSDAPDPDPIPVSPEEGDAVAKVTRTEQAARVQVVLEWIALGFSYRTMLAFAAKRWGHAPRTSDALFAAAKRTMSDPRKLSLVYARDAQLRRLTGTFNRRVTGVEDRDPMEPLNAIAKLLGLNAPEKTENRQEISTPDGQPLVQLFIPDNGRSITTEDQPAAPAPGT